MQAPQLSRRVFKKIGERRDDQILCSEVVFFAQISPLIAFLNILHLGCKNIHALYGHVWRKGEGFFMARIPDGVAGVFH